jgi:Domain of unknown function (DUF397)
MMNRLFWNANRYYRAHGITADDVARSPWRKSVASSYNGSCVEIARLAADRIGVRDTKDVGRGPVLIFTENEWEAFRSGIRSGEFDSL